MVAGSPRPTCTLSGRLVQVFPHVQRCTASPGARRTPACAVLHLIDPHGDLAEDDAAVFREIGWSRPSGLIRPAAWRALRINLVPLRTRQSLGSRAYHRGLRVHLEAGAATTSGS